MYENMSDILHERKESMKPLISRYRKFLVTKKEDSNRYIDCWCRNEAKNGDRI